MRTHILRGKLFFFLFFFPLPLSWFSPYSVIFLIIRCVVKIVVLFADGLARRNQDVGVKPRD